MPTAPSPFVKLGALPVYPDLGRASEVLSILQLTKADVLVHAGPQFYGGTPHASSEYAASADQLTAFTSAVSDAAQEHGVKRVVSLSFGYLYESGRDAASEGDADVHDSDYSPMLRAESILRDSSLNGFIIRSGYVYGGRSADTAALADSIKRSQKLPAGTEPASWIHEDDLAAAILALLETDDEVSGIEFINAAADSPCSPNDFAAALARSIGLSEPSYASDGFLSMFREKTLRDHLLARTNVIDSSRIRERLGWRSAHSSIESGLEATALVWRMKDALNPADSYTSYHDKAAEAIEAFAYDIALPEPVAADVKPAAAEPVAAPKPAPVTAAAPAPSAGPTPWNEDEAKREERRLKALERKAKRAAKSAGG